MPMYSPAQSDQVVDTNPEERERARQDLTEHAANPTATKWVYIVMFIVLAALVILCAVGPHIPGGE